MAAARSQITANNTSRQIIASNMKAGGDSANSGTARPAQTQRRAVVNPTTAKPIQYNVAISRNMLALPGASGSISRHRMLINGDCQSPKLDACMYW